MKLLMITRKVDRADSLAGFVYNWVKKIGNNVDKLYVIAWQKSDRGDLPENIEIINLPQNKFLKIFALKIKAFKILLKVDGVFCHMNPEYTIIVGTIARLLKKKVVSWYVHSSVTWKMILMEKIANVCLSASEKSFRLPSKKLVITGHGIDIDLFAPSFQVSANNVFRLLTVGRISPTKDYESMIKAVGDIWGGGIKNIALDIIGAPGLREQQSYLTVLKEMVKNMNLRDVVNFLGPVPNNQISDYLRKANLFINLSGTGSLDKAVLEAMACGCLVLTSNEAFVGILPKELMVQNNQPKNLAEKIKWLMTLPPEKANQLRQQLRQEVVNNHNLDKLVIKIINSFK